MGNKTGKPAKLQQSSSKKASNNTTKSSESPHNVNGLTTNNSIHKTDNNTIQTQTNTVNQYKQQHQELAPPQIKNSVETAISITSNKKAKTNGNNASKQQQQQPSLSPIVLSSGAATIKYGFSDMETPNMHDFINKSIENKYTYYYHRPAMEDGMISDWGKIENIWYSIFVSKLKISPTNYDILIAESVRNSYTNTHRIIDIMFEKLKVNSICIMNENVLALFALNRYNGIVMNIGYRNTDCVPIMNGEVIEGAVKKFNNKAFDYTDDINVYIETLFNNNIHNVIYKSVMKCDESFREQLLNNIVIYGVEEVDGELMNDLDKRLETEIKGLLVNKGYGDYNVNVITPSNNREHLAWIGGAKFCQQNVFSRDLWIYNDEWNDAGNDEQWQLSKSLSSAFSNEFLKFIAVGYINQLSMYHQTPIDIIRCILFCCNGVVYQDFELLIDFVS